MAHTDYVEAEKGYKKLFQPAINTGRGRKHGCEAQVAHDKAHVYVIHVITVTVMQ